MRGAGVGEATANTIYYAVRLTGEAAWNANARDREAGRPRVIPRRKLRSIPPEATWAEFQKTLSE
jgi:hypothetical protein